MHPIISLQAVQLKYFQQIPLGDFIGCSMLLDLAQRFEIVTRLDLERQKETISLECTGVPTTMTTLVVI